MLKKEHVICFGDRCRELPGTARPPLTPTILETANGDAPVTEAFDTLVAGVLMEGARYCYGAAASLTTIDRRDKEQGYQYTQGRGVACLTQREQGYQLHLTRDRGLYHLEDPYEVPTTQWAHPTVRQWHQHDEGRPSVARSEVVDSDTCRVCKTVRELTGDPTLKCGACRNNRITVRGFVVRKTRGGGRSGGRDPNGTDPGRHPCGNRNHWKGWHCKQCNHHNTQALYSCWQCMAWNPSSGRHGGGVEGRTPVRPERIVACGRRRGDKHLEKDCHRSLGARFGSLLSSGSDTRVEAENSSSSSPPSSSPATAVAIDSEERRSCRVCTVRNPVDYLVCFVCNAPMSFDLDPSADDGDDAKIEPVEAETK